MLNSNEIGTAIEQLGLTEIEINGVKKNCFKKTATSDENDYNQSMTTITVTEENFFDKSATLKIDGMIWKPVRLQKNTNPYQVWQIIQA